MLALVFRLLEQVLPNRSIYRRGENLKTVNDGQIFPVLPLHPAFFHQ